MEAQYHPRHKTKWNVWHSSGCTDEESAVEMDYTVSGQQVNMEEELRFVLTKDIRNKDKCPCLSLLRELA